MVGMSKTEISTCYRWKS